MLHDEISDRFATEAQHLVARASAMLRNRWDAEDAVQDAFVRALRYQSSLRPASNIRPWLRVIVRRCAMDLVRDRSRIVTEDVNDGFPPVASAEDTFFNEFDNALLDVIRSHQLLADRLIQGRSFAEIAAETGVPSSTLRTRYRRLRTIVRRELATAP
jgi:RNA polymerase sigma-70 factor (ECF subfamily)